MFVMYKCKNNCIFASIKVVECEQCHFSALITHREYSAQAPLLVAARVINVAPTSTILRINTILSCFDLFKKYIIYF